MPSIAEFRLSITRALADQLVASLELLTPAPLQPDELAAVERRGGVYHLYLRGDLVYVGKADESLYTRLRRHRRKISGRRNIDPAEVGFTALYVDDDLSAVAPETMLIDRYRGSGRAPWNFGGFGNNDPGRERDTSAVEATNFDALYPANLDFPCEGVQHGLHQVVDLLPQVKRCLPFVFRYEDYKKRRDLQPAAYHTTTVSVPTDNPTADTVFAEVARAMPTGWQVTALPGYVIMYEESRPYPSAFKVY